MIYAFFHCEQSICHPVGVAEHNTCVTRGGTPEPVELCNRKHAEEVADIKRRRGMHTKNYI
jgi:hypothetical protein